MSANLYNDCDMCILLPIRFPTLSIKNLAPKDWKFLPFKFKIRDDLKAPLLIEAAPPWNFWEFMLTCGLFVSGTNTYHVRKRVNQHPAVRYEIYFVSKQFDLIISRASLKGARG